MNHLSCRLGFLAVGLGLSLSGCTGTIVDPGNGSGDDGTGGDGAGSPGSGAAIGNVNGAGDGNVAQPGTLDDPSVPPTFGCDPAAVPKAEGWRKLTTAQYRNTVRDLVGFALKNAGAAEPVMTGIASVLDKMPADVRVLVPGHLDLKETYRRLDQAVAQIHVDTGMDVGIAVGAALTTSARLGTVVGTCATDGVASNDAACITSFVQTFGERAFRRPLTADEVMFYRGFYGTGSAIDPLGFADVIGGFLNAAQFLYHVEHGDSPVTSRPGVYRLSPFEIASRLSYQFWDAMPDEGLWAAAKSGDLATPAGYQAELDRAIRDPRARPTLEAFYSDWLKLQNLPSIDGQTKGSVFKTFAGANLPTPQLRQSLIDDVTGMTGYYTWEHPGGVAELLTSDLSFARGRDLAAIYGVPAWSGSGEPPKLPAGRPGLLTRAAFLSTGTETTRPIIKGVFVRHTILCDDIPPPPNNAEATKPKDPNADRTTRQFAEDLTQSSSDCAACHAPLINPIGFATENFDSLGRMRSEEILFDAQGNERLRLPVDTRSLPQILADDQTPSAGAVDLMRLIIDSGKVEACLARSYFRFSFARWENLDVDGCTLEKLRASAAGGGGLPDLLREVGAISEFQERSFKE